jgi:hypothetical protein
LATAGSFLEARQNLHSLLHKVLKTQRLYLEKEELRSHDQMWKIDFSADLKSEGLSL